MWIMLWLLWGFMGVASAGQVTLSWDAPTLNADGTPLTDLDGYRLWHGPASGNYPTVMDVGNVTTATLTLAGNQTYFFVVTARDQSGNESFPSNEVSATLPPDVVDPTPLIAGYAFNEGSGFTVGDVTGVHPGTIQGAVWTSSGKYGKALRFDGINDWVTIPDHPDFDLTTGMTLMAWVYPTVTLTGWRTLLQKEGPTGFTYYLHANSDANRPATGLWINGEQALKAGSRLVRRVWTHVAATWDGTRQRLYLNGVSVGSRPQTGTLPTSTGVLRIGANSAYGEWFIGRLDEVRLYRTALTAAEIETARQTPLTAN